MRAGGGHGEQQQREQFQKKEQGQLQAMDFCAAFLGLNAKAPEHEAGDVPAAKAVPQDVDGGERGKCGHRSQRQRVGEERNHAGTTN